MKFGARKCFTPVSHSVRGGGRGLPPGGSASRGLFAYSGVCLQGTLHSGEGLHPGGSWADPSWKLRNAVNEQAVRILLESRSGTVNLKSFVGKDFLRIQWIFEFSPKLQIRNFFGLKLWIRNDFGLKLRIRNYFGLFLRIVALFDLTLWIRVRQLIR